MWQSSCLSFLNARTMGISHRVQLPFLFLMSAKLSSKTNTTLSMPVRSHTSLSLSLSLSLSRMNQAPTVGFEKDVGSRTTHHFMYPESAKNLPANVSFVLVPFKALDLMWIASALSTGQIRL